VSNLSNDRITDEFVGADLGDGRRTARLSRLVESMAKDPSLSFPKAMPDAAALEAAYRFFNNVKVRPEEILRPHVDQTVQRVLKEAVILVAHDSSVVSFNSEGKEGLTQHFSKQQFLVHCALALQADETHRPLGLLAMSYHLQIKMPGKSLNERWPDQIRDVHALGIPQQNVVHLMDRESDDYDLLSVMKTMGARFVSRAKFNRRTVDGDYVEASLGRAVMQAEREVCLSRRTGKRVGSKQLKAHPPREERVAKLSITAERVTIPRTPTARDSAAKSIQLNVVRVWEPTPPPNETAVEWVLYTSEPIDTAEQILQVVDWYRARWTIEEFFKSLKTGCSFEKRQLGDLHSLSNAMALLAPMAWHLLLIKSEAHSRPLTPARDVLDEEELEVLRLAAVRGRGLPENPTVLDVMLSIAALGGHQKHNGLPGWQSLARGYQQLRTLVAGWSLRRAVEAGILPPLRDQ
jgi:hypothetical protein